MAPDRGAVHQQTLNQGSAERPRPGHSQLVGASAPPGGQFVAVATEPLHHVGGKAVGGPAKGRLDLAVGLGLDVAWGALTQVLGDLGCVGGRQLAVEVRLEHTGDLTTVERGHDEWNRPAPARIPPRRAAICHHGGVFDDLLSGNDAFATTFAGGDLGARPRRHLSVVTCMDVRIDTFAALGLELGDAHVIRNAGARLTDDVLRSLVAGIELLGVERVAIVQHTDCGMASITDDELRDLVSERRGVDEVNLEFLTIDDHAAAIRADVEQLQQSPLMPPDLVVGGFLYDVTTGRLRQVA